MLITIVGYQIPFKRQPLQVKRPPETVFSVKQAALLQEEVQSLLQKGAISLANSPGGFYSTLFLVLEVPQPVGGSSPLQNGGYCNIERPPETWGLDGEGRPEGCLLHHSNSPIPSTVSEIYSGRELFPIYLSPVQPVMCPLDIYKSGETSDGPSEGMGQQDNYIHRRYADPSRVQGASSTTLVSVVVVSSRSPRLHCQQREVSVVSSPGARVPRVVGGLTKSSTQVAQREVGSDSQGSKSTREQCQPNNSHSFWGK